MVEEKPEKRIGPAPTAKTPERKPPRRAVERRPAKPEDSPGDPWRVIAQVLNKQPRRKH
jgi:hypothetical protein